MATRETRIPVLEPLGVATIQFLTFVGETWMLLADVCRRITKGPVEWAETVNQMAFVGVASVPIVALTGFSSGAVFSLYLSQFLSRYGATSFVGATVGLT